MKEPKYLKFGFSLETSPPTVKLDRIGAGAFNRFFMKDSVFRFYPFCEFMIPDTATLWTEENYPPEGLIFKLEIADDPKGVALKHDFYLSEFAIPNTTSIESMAGNAYFALLSSWRKKDQALSKTYTGPASAAVTQAMPAGMTPKIKPDSTIKTWKRGLQTFSEFARACSDYVEAPSPVMTFCNLRNEFIFMDINSLLELPAVAKLSFGKNRHGDLGTSTLKDYIRDVSYTIQGLPGNEGAYRHVAWFIDDSGNYYKSVKKPSDVVDENLPILSDLGELDRKVKIYGVGDPLGWQNSRLRNSSGLPFRLRIATAMNTEIVSGDVVEIELDGVEGQSVYSGKWLVIESGHGFGDEGNAVSLFELGRNFMNFSPDYTLKQELIV